MFAQIKMNKRSILISGMIIALVTYIARVLPVDFGVHTIIILIATTYILTFYNEIQLKISILYMVIVMLIISLCEFMNVLIPKSFFKIELLNGLWAELMKILYTMPSLILFALINLVFYRFFYKERCK